MTTAIKPENPSRTPRGQVFWFLGLSVLNVAASRYWPGSVGATIVQSVFLGWGTIWLAFRIRAGYLRRKPYWTRDSWLRYLRLAVMPVIALALVLFLSSFDKAPSFFGAPRSPTRTVVASVLVAMLLLGVLGLMRALDWLATGEPSEQFTRTRWFQRRRVPG
jgi:hypothetical protein